MVVNFFQQLYMDSSTSAPYPVQGCFPNISNRDLSRLSIDIIVPEIRKALFDMGSLRAPDPDGYQAVFFQS